MQKNIVFILFVVLCAFIFTTKTIQAQGTYTISGLIVDETNLPLPGAVVQLHEIEKAVATDANGHFAINNVPAGKYEIHVSFVGYLCNDHTPVVVTDRDITVKYQLVPHDITLHEVVVSAGSDNMMQRDNSLQIETINNNDLMKNASSSLASSIEKIAGVSSMQIGQGFAKPVIRGLGFQRVAVVENGIKQEGQQWGADHGLEIDQFNVERLFVVKGPASLMYGSDAVGGIIQIEPEHSPHNDTLHTAFMLLGKSVNNLYAASGLAKVKRGHNYLRARITYQRYGDYNVPADNFYYNRYRLPIYDKKLKNTAGDEKNFFVSLTHEHHHAEYTFLVSNVNSRTAMFAGSHGIPRANNLLPDGNNRNIDYPSQSVNHFKFLQNTHIKHSHDNIDFDAGYQLNLRREFSLPHTHGLGDLPLGNLELQFALHTFSSRLLYKRQLSLNTTLATGADAQYQIHRIGGYAFLLPSYTRGAGGVFSFVEYKPSKTWTLNVGARFDAGHIEIQSYTDPYVHLYIQDSIQAEKYKLRSPQISTTLGNFTGGAGISYNINDKNNVKLNLGKSFRLPSVNELSSNGVHHGSFKHELGDATLKPEESYQADLAYNFSGTTLQVAVSPFVNYFTNFIFLSPSGKWSLLPDAGQMYEFRQRPVLRAGGEITADYTLWKFLQLSTSAEYVYAVDTKEYYPVPFTPPLNVLLEASYLFADYKYAKNMQFTITTQLTAAQRLTARNEQTTEGYNVHTVGISGQSNIQKISVQWSLQVHNLLNTRYYNHLSFYRTIELPEAGRNVQLSLIFTPR